MQKSIDKTFITCNFENTSKFKILDFRLIVNDMDNIAGSRFSVSSFVIMQIVCRN